MILLLIVVVLTLVVSASMYFDDMLNNQHLSVYFISCAIPAGIIYILISFMLSVITSVLPSDNVVANKEIVTPIYSITVVGSDSSGSFVLGYSSVTYYYYYKKDGGLLVGNANAADTALVLGDKHAPYLDVKYQICKKEGGFHKWYYNFFSPSLECHVKRSIHVPSNTVKLQYNIDSNFK